jgi:hypothetical protein
VAPRCPAIDWRSFLSDLDWERQFQFEDDLAVRGISLGEYMEVVEQAALEVCACTASRDSDFEKQELLRVASAMLTTYVARKRLLADPSWTDRSLSPPLETARERGGTARAKRLRLRSLIHNRIEAIKNGLVTL